MVVAVVNVVIDVVVIDVVVVVSKTFCLVATFKRKSDRQKDYFCCDQKPRVLQENPSSILWLHWHESFVIGCHSKVVVGCQLKSHYSSQRRNISG